MMVMVVVELRQTKTGLGQCLNYSTYPEALRRVDETINAPDTNKIGAAADAVTREEKQLRAKLRLILTGRRNRPPP